MGIEEPKERLSSNTVQQAAGLPKGDSFTLLLGAKSVGIVLHNPLTDLVFFQGDYILIFLVAKMAGPRSVEFYEPDKKRFKGTRAQGPRRRPAAENVSMSVHERLPGDPSIFRPRPILPIERAFQSTGTCMLVHCWIPNPMACKLSSATLTTAGKAAVVSGRSPRGGTRTKTSPGSSGAPQRTDRRHQG